MYVTGSAKRDQVGTIYIITDGKYLESYVQYSLSINYKMLRIKFLLMVKISLQQLKQIISFDTINLKSVVKFCVPTWSIFAVPVIYGQFI